MKKTARHIQLSAQFLHKSFIGIGFRAPYPVVDMTCHHLETDLVSQCTEYKKQAYRIRSARYACDHHIILFDHAVFSDK